MSTAIVYYSQAGNTQQTAEKIAEILGADVIRIEPEKAYPDKGFKKFFWGGKSATMKEKPALLPYTFDAEKYDTVIIGTPVWAGTFTPPIRTFVEENKGISNKKIALFTCMSGAGDIKTAEKLRQLIGIESFAATLSLIDPKDKANDKNDEKIKEFCGKLG